jgi:hypothetical protein
VERPDGSRRRVMVTATMAFIPDVDVVISYGRVKSSPSIESLGLELCFENNKVFI